ncbi:MAG: bifunctional DNA primase/polymerase [Syntrophobacterales bacterium]|nr:bifunctional DNA primase/polymerase [Syntrophobacterales bacterium]
MAIKDFAVRVGHEEIGRILNLKENLNQKELLLSYAPHYEQLGWALVAMKAPEGTPLDLDLNRPAEDWAQQLSDAGADQFQVNIGIRTGKASRLLVLEVNKGEGALSLDQCGDWRADCVAETGGCREQHYYFLPPEGQNPPSFFLAPQVLIYGEGGMVLTPPSLEPQAREPWRWLRPPWENPPQPPKPAVWQFLKDYLPAAMVTPEVPSWTEIYRVIASHGAVLQSLLVPPTSQDDYYQTILKTALAVGLRESSVLLGLLWHAPHGGGRHNPDKWDYFQQLVTQARAKPDGYPWLPALPARLDGSDPHQIAPAPGNPSPAAMPPGMDALDMLAGGGPADLGLQDKDGASAPRFDQSVSGQFFQLLAGLGEKVIMESCRYEAMLGGLNTKAGDIGRLVSQWEQCFAGSSPPTAESEPKPPAGTVEFGWDSVVNVNAYKKQQATEIQAAAADFLTRNPDLAGDRHKVQMVIFCLKNYITINPEYAALPFREKLDRAGGMARGFLQMKGTAS